MSDNIELPVNYERMGPPTITITPDLARQIVTLAGQGMIPQGPGISEPFLGVAHQADLEKAHAGDDEVGPFTKEHMGRMASDIAAKDAALSARHLQVKEMHAEIAALRARVAELEKEADQRVAGNAKIRHDHLCVIEKMQADLAAERGKHAESRAVWRDTMVERTAERDAARAEVAQWKERAEKAERECREWEEADHLTDQEHSAIDAAQAERDRALADLAAERERREKAEVRADTRDGELERARQNAEFAKRDLEVVADDCRTMRKAYDTMAAQRDAARADLRGEKAIHSDTCAALDAARAEVAALKARKVKLPNRIQMATGGLMYYADSVYLAIRAAGVEVES